MNKHTLHLLREAAEWRLLGLLFECPNDIWKTDVAKLASEVADPQLKTAALAAQTEANAALYHTAFAPGGPAAPREVSHCHTITPGQLLHELTAYYHAFAYHPRVQEPPDHVAAQVGFIAYLKLKEAFARERGEIERAQIVADAAKKFIEDHLNSTAEPLANCLAHSGINYLATAAAVLLKRVGQRRAPQLQPLSATPQCPVENGCAFSAEEQF